jgi:hypothetical protein
MSTSTPGGCSSAGHRSIELVERTEREIVYPAGEVDLDDLRPIVAGLRRRVVQLDPDVDLTGVGFGLDAQQLRHRCAYQTVGLATPRVLAGGLVHLGLRAAEGEKAVMHVNLGVQQHLDQHVPSISAINDIAAVSAVHHRERHIERERHLRHCQRLNVPADQTRFGQRRYEPRCTSLRASAMHDLQQRVTDTEGQRWERGAPAHSTTTPQPIGAQRWTTPRRIDRRS